MSDLIPMAERHTRALTELMELGLALARKLQDRALAAATLEEERAASLAFHRISRSVRQTLALETQLERMRRRMLREDIEDAQAQTQQAVERRKAQVKAVLTRLVWSEHEADEVDAMIEGLDSLLAEDALADDFLTQPVEALIARLSRDLGLAAEADAEEPDGASPAATAPDPAAGSHGSQVEGDWSPPPPPADSS
jgi:hypothetical protein